MKTEKRDLKYKVSDFWLYQTTFEKLLQHANLENISVNQWLINAVNDKLANEKVTSKKRNDIKERDKVLKIISQIRSELDTEILHREVDQDRKNVINMEKARKLFYKDNCEYCGKPKPKFFHVLKPKDKSVLNQEAWKSFCNSTCLKNIGYTKNINYIEPNKKLKEKREEVNNLIYSVSHETINYKDVDINKIIKEIQIASEDVSKFVIEGGMGEVF